MSAALNYHHLRYFREVAHEGHLGRAADKLNVSQSALSTQIRQLEARLGHALFDRVGRRLELTEAGRIALVHADRIFGTGDALLATFGRHGSEDAPLRVGALSTLSRNFQIKFLRPLLKLGHPVALRSGNTLGLLEDLAAMTLDVVLTTELPADGGPILAHALDKQTVGLHGRPDLIRGAALHDILDGAPLILPTDSVIRTRFMALLDRKGLTPRIAAEVDDMAMIRLLAREGVGLAVAPGVVLADEIASGLLVTAPVDLGIGEPFYALTVRRDFPHPALAHVLT